MSTNKTTIHEMLGELGKLPKSFPEEALKILTDIALRSGGMVPFGTVVAAFVAAFAESEISVGGDNVTREVISLPECSVDNKKKKVSPLGKKWTDVVATSMSDENKVKEIEKSGGGSSDNASTCGSVRSIVCDVESTKSNWSDCDGDMDFTSPLPFDNDVISSPSSSSVSAKTTERFPNGKKMNEYTRACSFQFGKNGCENGRDCCFAHLNADDKELLLRGLKLDSGKKLTKDDLFNIGQTQICKFGRNCSNYNCRRFHTTPTNT